MACQLLIHARYIHVVMKNICGTLWIKMYFYDQLMKTGDKTDTFWDLTMRRYLGKAMITCVGEGRLDIKVGQGHICWFENEKKN